MTDVRHLVREPGLMWHPWVGHWFPGFTPDRMGELSLSQYVAMFDFMQKAGK